MYEINPKAVYNHFGTYLFLRNQVADNNSYFLIYFVSCPTFRTFAC